EIEERRELPRAGSLEVLLVARRHAHHEPGGHVAPGVLEEAVLAAEEEVANAVRVHDVLLEPRAALLGRDRDEAVVVRIALELAAHRPDGEAAEEHRQGEVHLEIVRDAVRALERHLVDPEADGVAIEPEETPTPRGVL